MCSGSIDGNNQLIIKGRFQQKQIENVLRRYISKFNIILVLSYSENVDIPDYELITVNSYMNSNAKAPEKQTNKRRLFSDAKGPYYLQLQSRRSQV